MIAILAIRTPSSRRKVSNTPMGLKACGARVFVEANETVCGIEALVLREGSCRINRKMFLAILKSYDRLVNVTINQTSGNFTLSFNGKTTGNIAWDATAATIDTALESVVGKAGAPTSRLPGRALARSRSRS